MLGKKLSILALTVPMVAALAILRAWVAIKLVGWFIVPIILGITLPGVIPLAGTMILLKFVFPGQSDDKRTVNEWTDALSFGMESLAGSLVAFVLGGVLWWLS